MYAQSTRNAIQIRQSLLSPNPDLQDRATRQLGACNPHIELVGIQSALALDTHADTPHLTPTHIQRMLDATRAHLSRLPYLATYAARQDIIEKAQDVSSAALHHALQHGCYKIIRDHFLALCDDLSLFQFRIPEYYQEAA